MAEHEQNGIYLINGEEVKPSGKPRVPEEDYLDYSQRIRFPGLKGSLKVEEIFERTIKQGKRPNGISSIVEIRETIRKNLGRTEE